MLFFFHFLKILFYVIVIKRMVKNLNLIILKDIDKIIFPCYNKIVKYECVYDLFLCSAPWCIG